MKPKLLGIIIVLLILADNLSAQIANSRYFIPNPFPLAPNSTAFTKYGDYKVNYYTGVPDISINLFTAKSGSLELPITLSYHASGNRVSDVASWVGLGWSVSAGGSISRKVMGMPDDDVSGLLSGSLRDYNSLDLNNSNTDIDYARDVVTGYKDSRPDIFSYDIPGHSGKFFFESTNSLKPALIPFAPISLINSGTTGQFQNAPRFKIIDEHGTVSKFGFGTNTESTTTTTSTNTKSVNSAWMLESMISQDKRDSILFSYATQNITYPSATTHYDVVTDNVFISGTCPYVMNYTAGDHHNSLVYTSVNEQALSQILFKNGKVVFEMDGGTRLDFGSPSTARGLNKIKIYAFDFSKKAYVLQKSVVFYKSYFNPTGSSRLRLDSIQVLDAAGSTMQHYRFTYNTSITLPAYDSFAKDYWDYYNGKTTSTSLVPQMVVNANSNGVPATYTVGSSVANNRNSDSTYMQAYILQRIDFPTGGHTDFTYQTNRYYDAQHNLVQVGGLRIATVKSYDNVNAIPITKTYQYNSATFNAVLQSSYFTNTQQYRYWGGSNGPGLPGIQTGSENYTTFSSNPSNDLVPFDAAVVGYPSVTEYLGTPASNIGKIEYVFRDQPDSRMTSRSGVPIIQTFFYARGQLLKKTEFKNNGSGVYQVVKREVNTYTSFPLNNHAYAGMVIDKMAWDEGPNAMGIQYAGSGAGPANNFNQFIAQNYSIPSDDNYITGTTLYNYDQIDTTKFSTSAVSYKYDNIKHQQVTRSYHVDSKGNTNISTMKYPADYLAVGQTTTGNSVLDTMLNRNMQAEMIEKWDTVKNVSLATNGVTTGELHVFKMLGSTNIPVVPSKISRLRIAAPLTNFVPSSVVSGNLSSDSRYAQMISFDNYDTGSNLIQYTPRNSTPVSILWNYNNALPVLQIKNAVLGNYAYTSFETGNTGGWNYSGSATQDDTAPTGKMVYSLNNGSISFSNTDQTKAFVLSYWSNGGAATVNTGSFISGTPLRLVNGWTFYQHLIPTNVYSISVSGSTSIDELALYPQDAQINTYAYDPNGLTELIDPKGAVSNFEYDSFQRLKNVKDWNGNIIKNYGYHNYDMTIGNDVITGTITRNNCPAGTNPQSTSFTVAANKYYSSTKASANAEAQYDYNTNGQAYANKVCGCPVQMINFTLTNNTGLAGFQATFSGPQTLTYNFPTSGSTVVQIPAGTYSLQLPPVSPFNSHTWQLGNVRPTVTAPSANFSNVIIATGSSDSFVQVN